MPVGFGNYKIASRVTGAAWRPIAVALPTSIRGECRVEDETEPTRLDTAAARFAALAVAVNQLAVVLRLQNALDDDGVRLWERLTGGTIREGMRAGGRPDLAEGLAQRFEGKASAELAAMEETVRRSEAGSGTPS